MAVGEHLNALSQPRRTQGSLVPLSQSDLEVRIGSFCSCQQQDPSAALNYSLHTALCQLQDPLRHAVGSRVLCVASFDSGQREFCKMTTVPLSSFSCDLPSMK